MQNIKPIDPIAMLEHFPAWLSRDWPLGGLVYWVGNLLVDRGRGCGEAPTDTPVDKLATMAWDAFKRGQVTLVQQRIAEDVYFYWAIKRTPS